jgi:DUF4097 and DUF4098 domain-containing protein YvlB
MPSGGRLSVEHFNGPVEIVGWDAERIEINGTKYASTKEALDALRIETRDTAGVFEIRTVRPEPWNRWNGGVRYRIRVPRKVRLERIQSTNGALTAESIEGPVRMRTTNGSVKLIDVKGDAEAGSTNGRIELLRCLGAISATTTNGSINASSAQGRFTANTTNGGIDLTADDLDPNAASRLTATNGSVHLTLRSQRVSEIDVSTTNGGIAVRMPPAVASRLRASTSHGRISTDFPVEHLIANKGKRLDASLGSGGPLMSLRTTNGRIRIEKN